MTRRGIEPLAAISENAVKMARNPRGVFISRASRCGNCSARRPFLQSFSLPRRV
jgi:hypothetical protein